MSLKALVTTLILGSSSAVFARPVPTQASRRAEIARADRAEAGRYDRKRYEQKRIELERARFERARFERDRNLRERGHGRVIDHGPIFRGRR